MRYWMSFFSFALCLALVSGCDWDSSGDDTDTTSTWDDSYSWVDFSGTYRSQNGGLLVTGFNATPGSEPTTTPVTGEFLGTSTEALTSYYGFLDNKPLDEGSLVITVAGYVIRDTDGDGDMDGTSDTSGTIDYVTGAWSINLGANYIGNGENIIAAYSYTSGGTEGQTDPGNSGNTINSMTIIQTGNKLAFTDNRGATYSGTLTLAETPGGDSSGLTSGTVTAAFEVSGTSSSGISVKMVGTFSGTYTAGSEGGLAGDMTDRAINGSWIESTIQGDIQGVTI